METLVSENPRNMEYWSTAAYGNVKIQSLYGSGDKTGFVKVAVRTAVARLLVPTEKASTVLFSPLLLPPHFLSF